MALLRHCGRLKPHYLYSHLARLLLSLTLVNRAIIIVASSLPPSPPINTQSTFPTFKCRGESPVAGSAVLAIDSALKLSLSVPYREVRVMMLLLIYR